MIHPVTTALFTFSLAPRSRNAITGRTAQQHRAELEKLARKIAGRCARPAGILDRARVAAQAELDLARVRRNKVALIERLLACGNFDPPQRFPTVADA
jgi:hypothetical protein